MPRRSAPESLSHSLTSHSPQTGGDGGNSGNASGGQGSDFELAANHKISGGAGGSNSNGQETDCYGSCVTYVTQTSQGGNGGSASDSSIVSLDGNIANTDFERRKLSWR